MTPHFGSRVVGEEAHDKALREEKGGANVFGVRVIGAITGSGPVAEAKRATEHGVRVVEGGHYTDTKGNDVDALSIEELQNGLAENPTVFDSWYEGELAREDGPRPEALNIFREVEKGIKGAGRQEILKEIASLLGENSANAAQRADLAKAQREQLARQQERMEENVLLADADRVKALKERDENLNAVKDSKNASTQSQIIPLDESRQVDAIAEEQGLDIGGGAKSKSPSAPSKPSGNVNVATQQPGKNIITPKATDSDDDASDEGTPEELENSTVADLEAYLGEDAAKVKGTGADGRVLKADLLKAAKRKQRQSK